VAQCSIEAHAVDVKDNILIRQEVNYMTGNRDVAIVHVVDVCMTVVVVVVMHIGMIAMVVVVVVAIEMVRRRSVVSIVMVRRWCSVTIMARSRCSVTMTSVMMRSRCRCSVSAMSAMIVVSHFVATRLSMSAAAVVSRGCMTAAARGMLI